MVDTDLADNTYIYTGPGKYEISFGYDVETSIIVRWINTVGKLSEPKTNGLDYNIVRDGAVPKVEVLIDFGTGGSIFINRDVPLTQTWQGIDGTTPSPSGIMKALDRLTWIIQQVSGKLKGSIKTPANEDIDMTINTVAERSDQFFKYNVDGTPGIAAGITSVPVSSWAGTLLNDEDASAGRKTLEIEKRDVLSDNQTLETNKKYILTGGDSFTLPLNHSIGDSIDLYSEVYAEVKPQPSSGESVEYKGVYFITPDDSGKIKLSPKEKLSLIFSGLGYIPQEPAVKIANPSSLPPDTGSGVTFSDDGDYMVVTHKTTPYLLIYKRSGDTFTKLPNPSSLPASTGWYPSFSPDGTYLAVAHSSSPYITIYKRSGDVFTKLADPSTARWRLFIYSVSRCSLST